jgi:metal-responsive CopG/Arc/MetJ family transcriptional regulator
MKTTKVKLDRDLIDRLKEVANVAGYSDVEEFITRILEKELERVGDAVDEEAVKNQLRGLGYIE